VYILPEKNGGGILKVEETNDFQVMKHDWARVLKGNLLGDNIFFTWEWLSTWWKYFGEGRKLLILTVKDGDEVCAIAPLMQSSYKLPGFGNIKKIEFIGVRHSDYNNLIILKRETECFRLLIDYLEDTISDWDWIELKEIPESTENSSLLTTLFSGIPSNLTLKKRVCNMCPYVSLPNSFEILIEGLNKKIRKNLNYSSRRIKEKYHVELKRYDEAGFSIKEAMETFIKLHEARWALKSLPGSFKSQGTSFLSFHMEVAKVFADNNWLGLYFLMANEEPISVQYTFEYGKKMYHYLSGFDPSFSSYSVGNLITMFLLERSIKNGFSEYDMMRDDEPYKLMWTDTCRRSFEIRLVKKDLLNRYYNWVTWDNTISNIAEKLKLSLNKRSV
jgi:CelD/BcsL family acetyltransferase involved in cellulose biosynthesis